MSVRVLTIDEMLELPFGTPVILAKDWEHLPAGKAMTRGHGRAYLDDGESCSFTHSKSNWDYFEEGYIGIVEPEEQTFLQEAQPIPDAPLGVYRPELETRKVGKIRVELVDEGFPLAIREVAQVMTWAQDAKGYKDHDWQNLPNAEVALAAAASRHRTDHIKQRVVDGLDINECVDVESGLLHKAHEAFGVLAQLELVLRGKFVDSRPQIGV